MKFLALALIVLAAVAAIVGPQLFFVVDEKQQAIVTRFGEVQQSIRSPGLYVKTPFIDTTTYFDKRLLSFDAPPESLLTKDKKRLIIDVYARGRIVDPVLFRETVQTESQGKARAVDIITSELRREIASDNQAEIITTKREDIMKRVQVLVQPKLREFGIDIIDVRIKRADFPPEIAESVYARMQSERKRKADKERAEGQEIDAEVRAAVDREAAIIKATAQRQAEITRGEGEAEAIKIFAAAIAADPEFYGFQRSLEAYRKIFESNTTVILPADSDLFEFLQSQDGLNESFDTTP
jgi:membrane protease subunit HflC